MTNQRIAIAGGPQCGKTTLAYVLAGPGLVIHTDDLIPGNPWDEHSHAAAQLMLTPGPWVLEGTTVPRALRKFMLLHDPPAKPCDTVIWCDTPMAPQTPGQERMAKGNRTIMQAITPLLLARGVNVLAPPFPPDARQPDTQRNGDDPDRTEADRAPATT